ncbi:FMN-binding negative transcriptional regulator, partial [Staphylococcus saprophyticus]|uniref:FMN-binding negative transcriptional regulator n=1 Tax=Staphylococcus saprophyticus TaxID=29385 RepID=UPI0011A09AA3
MIYIPKYYQIKHYHQIKPFINPHNFPTLLSIHPQQPLPTHLPLNIYHHHNHLYLSPHLPKPNHQSPTFNNNNSILLIFQPPHRYLSSTSYQNQHVPT